MKNYKNLLIVSVVAAIVGASASTIAVKMSNNDSETPLADSVIGANDNSFVRTAYSHALETDFTKSAEKTVNAVVSIKSFVTPRQQRQGFIDPFEFFFGQGNDNRRQQEQNRKPQQSGLGSGVIITTDGYIVTNNHVVDGAEKLEVTLNDNRSFNAQVIGTDPTTDLALLKIDAENLSPLEFGNSDEIKVGEWVLAVGNPFGFTSTVTTGIVSAKARSISSAINSQPMGVESFIQTDAAVNPGNSGGALVTTDGLLIGINTAIYSSTGNYAGYSFAIPSNIVSKVISDIKQYGIVQRAVLGISFTELSSDLAKEKKITAVNEGIYVAEVLDRSAAKEAGIEEGDVIIKLNGIKVKDKGTMMEQMAKYRPGDKLSVTYVRDNKQHNTSMILRNNQGSTEVTKSNDYLELGCAFTELTNEQMNDLQISHGVEVSAIKNGKFKNAGIKPGFIILDINDVRISSKDDVKKVYKSIMNSNSGSKVMFITGIYPSGIMEYYAVKLSDK